MERKFSGVLGKVVRYTAIAFVIFQLISVYFLPLPELRQRVVHVFFAIVLSLLILPARASSKPATKIPIWDWILAGLVIAASVKIFLQYYEVYSSPGEGSALDLWLGIALLIGVLESARRTTGWVFTIIVILTLLYVVGFGNLIPGKWGFRGLDINYALMALYRSNLGTYGNITGVSAMQVSLFIIYGNLLVQTGTGRAFIDLAVAAVGRFRGGPAKVAVVASALFGMISGSSVANAASMGTFTIPMMKKAGYQPAFAAAVEATSSTAGLITPPVMGSAAFIMSQLTGIPYLTLCYYAIFPVSLYYISVFLAVHAEAVKLNLAPMSSEDRNKLRSEVSWYRLASAAVSFVCLLTLVIIGFSLQLSAFVAILSVCLLFLFRNLSPSELKDRFFQLLDGMNGAGMALLKIVPLLVSSSIVVHLFNLSGLGTKFVETLTLLSGGSPLPALILGAFAVIVLGTGLSAPACYVLTAALIAPSFMLMGIGMAPAHFFLFYLSALAPLTPPVCTVIMVACGIAQEPNWVKTAIIALRIGIAAFLMPFFFVMSPSMLGIGNPTEIALDVGTALIGVFFFSIGLFGYGWIIGRMNIIARLFAVVAGAFLLYPDIKSDLFGISAVALALLLNLIFNKLLRYPKKVSNGLN